MKLMLHTGFIDYKTFHQTSYKTIYGERVTIDPIGKGKVYDISTPEKERAAKVDVLRTVKDETLIHYPQKPKEPVFTLAQLRDTELVTSQTEKYEADLAQYKADYEAATAQIAFFEALEAGQTPDDPDNLVDTLFTKYTEYYEIEYVPRIYFYDLA